MSHKCFQIRFFVFLSLLLVAIAAKAQQKEANTWYFGNYLGLDFNSGTAVPLNDGQLNTIEGVATISDSNGALLFYTDGIKIWNKFHQVMPNGIGLFGDPSSSQSAIIVPKIGDPARYYVFTVDQLSGPKGLNYSVVNMALDGGKGDVEIKNSPLVNNVVEKITAVRHCNNRDVWVVAHGSVSDIYYSFLVNPAGINTTPVISHTGTLLLGIIPPGSQDSTSLGYLKASPNGKKIAAAHWTMNVDVSDFDNVTGQVSNSISLYQPGDPHYLSYGVEFSPNSKLLYTTVFYIDPANFQKHNALFQYDISLATSAAIRASQQVISITSDPIQVYAALQIAPDGKMYMAKNVYKDLAAVNDPNVYGTGCNFNSVAVSYTLPAQKSSFGLPTFIQSYFYPPDSFTHALSCLSLTGNFNYVPAANVVSILWNFGDTASGVNNTSIQNNPSHTFSAPGTYTIRLVKFTTCGSDTIIRQISTDAIDINLGPDTTVCGSTSVLLNSTGAGSTNSFQWQDGSTNPTFLATAPGLYWVQASNASGCTKRDSILVSFKSLPVFNLGNDQSICDKDSLTLNATTSGAISYLWNNGAITTAIKAYQTGTYWCEVNNGGCIFRDSLIITAIKPLPPVNLGNNIITCEGVPVTLDATYSNSVYLWQDGSTNPLYNVTNSGTYRVIVTNNGCSNSDTITVNFDPKPRFSLGADKYICLGNSIQLKPVTDPSWQLQWQDGSSAPVFTVTQIGTYTLTATNNCGATTDDLKVLNGVCRVFVPNGFTPNNDGRNDSFKALGTELVTTYNLKIYDRAGQIVFETNDKNKGWDGKYGGSISSTAVYIYLLTYAENNLPQTTMLKGTLTLIR